MLENTMIVNNVPVMSLSSMAMLVELRISTWTARKRDNETTMEVNTSKEADQDSGSVYKYLMAGSDHLKKIEKYSAKCRAWNGSQTLPWMKGVNLLPMDNFFVYREQLATMEANFYALVDDFIKAYPQLKNDQAFKLGKYYRAEEFPDVETLPRRFKFEYNFLPVPEKGDFRINCEARIRDDLAQQYEKMYTDKLASAMREPWDRLHEMLVRMAERLTDTDNGERKIFRDSLLSNAIEMCDLLTRINVTKDPELEKARRELERALSGYTIESLRESQGTRMILKSNIDDILGKFNW